jgi:hypothetical protein
VLAAAQRCGDGRAGEQRSREDDRQCHAAPRRICLCRFVGRAARPPSRRSRRRKLRALGQDPGLELAQLRARLKAQVLAHAAARVAVGLERLGLPAAAVQREHELSSKALAERVLADEPIEFAGDLPVAPERQVGVHALLEGDEAQLVEPRDLLPCKRLVGEVRQRRAPPQRQPLAQPARRAIGLARGECVLADADRSLEAVHVEILGAEPQQIAVGPRHEHVGVALGAVVEVLA